jgi:hypothetical protein
MLLKDERNSRPTGNPTASAIISSLMRLNDQREHEPTAQPRTSDTHLVADAAERRAEQPADSEPNNQRHEPGR